MAGRYALLSRDLKERPLRKKASTEMRKERVTQHDFGSHVKVLRKVSCAELEPGMFARWAESSPTSESSPLERKKWEPQGRAPSVPRELSLWKRQ